MNPRSFQSDAAPASAPLPEQLLRVFHDQTRAPVPLGTAERPLELDGPVRKHYDLDPAGHFAMVESPDGLGDDPDGLVLRVRDFFAQRGQKVEWKTYDYDEPSDLGARLEAAGFVREDDESLILGEAAPLAAQDLALPEWRGRGLYRATLLHRARLGLDRGKEYVRVDASPDSEPILRRLGLHRVATTTPYVFDPRA